jgi:DNA-binding response OmpR family regulator
MGKMEKKVLIVDNKHFVLGFLQTILETERYLVFCLDDGKYLGDTILLYGPHVIILDIMLGSIDGRDLCEDLNRNPQTSQIPIIMISAFSESLARGNKVCMASAVISKPFDIDYLKATVLRLIA